MNMHENETYICVYFESNGPNINMDVDIMFSMQEREGVWHNSHILMVDDLHSLDGERGQDYGSS